MIEKCFRKNYSVYMMPFVFFMDENNLQYINLDAKMYYFINHETKEWNIHSISSFFPLNVLADIRAIFIH